MGVYPWAAAAPLGPEPDNGSVLFWGDDDLEWMDVNECRLDRLVGTITVAMQVAQFTTNGYGPPLCRLGLLLVEEIEDQGSRPGIDLFDPESIEEYEWMWLSHIGEYEYGGDYIVDTQAYTRHRRDVALDTHNRRKLGKKDALVLYHQWGFPITADGPPEPEPPWDVAASVFWTLRGVMVSK